MIRALVVVFSHGGIYNRGIRQASKTPAFCHATGTPARKSLNHKMQFATKTPPALSPHAESVRALPGKWYIAETYPRHEKSAAFGFIDRGVGFFLPLATRIDRHRNRLTVPLFPGCVFVACQGTPDWYTVREHPSVYRMLAVGNQPRLIDDLAALETAVLAGLKLDPYTFAEPGVRCRVKSGPFEGYDCEVVRREDVDKVIVEMCWLGGRKFEMPLDAALLEPT